MPIREAGRDRATAHTEPSGVDWGCIWFNYIHPLGLDSFFLKERQIKSQIPSHPPIAQKASAPPPTMFLALPPAAILAPAAGAEVEAALALGFHIDIASSAPSDLAAFSGPLTPTGVMLHHELGGPPQPQQQASGAAGPPMDDLALTSLILALPPPEELPWHTAVPAAASAAAGAEHEEDKAGGSLKVGHKSMNMAMACLRRGAGCQRAKNWRSKAQTKRAEKKRQQAQQY